jgi:hypothetical protein
MKNTISSLLILTGIIMMAGSANDCDGACMETANTLSEMLMVAFLGLVVSGSGALLMLYKNKNVNQLGKREDKYDDTKK